MIFILFILYVCASFSVRVFANFQSTTSEPLQWHQMTSLEYLPNENETHFQFFTNSILCWRYSGLLSIAENYDLKAIRNQTICAKDTITLESQNNLIYVVDRTHFRDVTVPAMTKFVEYFGSKNLDITDSHHCRRPAFNLTFASRDMTDTNFFDPKNWVLCDDYEYCRNHYFVVPDELKSHHVYKTFRLDLQRVPFPGSQFVTLDGMNGPTLVNAPKKIAQSIEWLNVSYLFENNPPRILNPSEQVSQCDDSLKPLICPYLDKQECRLDCMDPLEPKCSCKKVCGTMIQIGSEALKVHNLRNLVELICVKWPPYKQERKNMAIIKHCGGRKVVKNESCELVLQILSLDYPDETMTHVSNVLTSLAIQFDFNESVPLPSAKNRVGTIGVSMLWFGVLHGSLLYQTL